MRLKNISSHNFYFTSINPTKDPLQPKGNSYKQKQKKSLKLLYIIQRIYREQYEPATGQHPLSNRPTPPNLLQYL